MNLLRNLCPQSSTNYKQLPPNLCALHAVDDCFDHPIFNRHRLGQEAPFVLVLCNQLSDGYSQYSAGYALQGAGAEKLLLRWVDLHKLLPDMSKFEAFLIHFEESLFEVSIPHSMQFIIYIFLWLGFQGPLTYLPSASLYRKML